MLCDAGPLIALIDRTETQNHQRCRAVLNDSRGPLITTWPCLTEAMYFLGNRGGLPYQRLLWRYIETGALRIHSTGEHEVERIRLLMETYSDIPMDLADASMVSAAESLGLSKIFTMDSHFYAFKINGATDFELLPA